jgi:transcriptional/translational regulatory protein YebC/TACO1
MLIRTDGGPDPAFNSRLAIAVSNAKRGQLSKTSIESAIARGQGKSVSGAALENVTIEALLPFGVATIIEYQTDSKGRVLQDIRYIIKNCGGSVTPTAFLFDKKGKIWFEEKEGMGVDEAMDEAIEAGADDITMEDNKLVVETPPTEVTAVAQKLQETLQLKIHKTELLFIPKEESLVTLSEEQGAQLQEIITSIEDEQSLQSLYVNAVSQ